MGSIQILFRFRRGPEHPAAVDLLNTARQRARRAHRPRLADEGLAVRRQDIALCRGRRCRLAVKLPGGLQFLLGHAVHLLQHRVWIRAGFDLVLHQFLHGFGHAASFLPVG